MDWKVKTFLITGMLVSGVCNTILNKFQDMQCVNNCSDPDPAKREYFEQPVFQTLNMFIGETFCMVVIYASIFWDRISQRNGAVVPAIVPAVEAQHSGLELKGWKVFLFWLPTLCDLTATTLMNVGLIYTSASVYQMLRGAVVIFTGTFSWLFLHRQLRVYKWASLFLVVFGVSIVGLSSVLFPQKKPSNLLRGSDNHLEEQFDWESAIGVAMVLGAQIFTATQFVIEEKVMAKYSVPPLRAVGLEGTFGLTSVLAAMPVLYLLFGKSHPGGYFDLYETWRQVTIYPQVWGTGIAIAFSIAFFNFFGLSVTASVNATARSTIDTCRTLFIWMVSLGLGWERFSWVQVIGFTVLVTGTLIFNDAIPYFSDPEEAEPGEHAPLLSDLE